MANPYIKVTPKMEQQNKYYEALKKWKNEKPTAKSMFNNQMGAYGSEKRKNNQAKLDKAVANWKSKEPKKSSFTKTSAPTSTTTRPTTTKTSTKTSTKNVGQGTVLKRGLSKADTKRTVKKFDSIMKNAKGGKSAFGRKLLGKLKFSGSGPRSIMRGKIR